MGQKPKKEILCFCNQISKEAVQEAIQAGAKTLNEIYDATTAGVGACGGSCRRKIAPMLEEFLINGKFSPPKKS